ncbi:uncharacterized protein LOC110432099 [Sorghum bicolor]|uniref:uncharacterized protein LOC110432099 n=1 Tax=Sorghum bicolor TaxID=4558 RepID=UPI000B425A47|nr:uncharacterized protein LOC110432099 [Sorghum bicolor]|eukprot:XP_021307744.1 uncharacterized protein LOC110432099 [Sorghum bicolor]
MVCVHPRLRHRAGAAGPACHWQRPRPVAAATDQHRPRTVRGLHGARGGAEARRLLALTRANMPAMNIMWQAPVRCSPCSARQKCSPASASSSSSLRPDTGRDEEPQQRARTALHRRRELPLNSAVLSAVAVSTAACGVEPEWVPDDLHKGRLDYFFSMMAALGAALLALLHPIQRPS